MTQFFLFADRPTEPPPSDLDVDLALLRRDEALLRRAAQELFGDADRARRLSSSDLRTERLFLEAQRSILDDDEPIERTPLGAVLDWVAASGTCAAIFYGGDWASLPLACTAAELRRLVEEQLDDPRREIYAAFRPRAASAARPPDRTDDSTS